MSVTAWKTIAMGEEAATYAYGVLAARLPAGSERNRAADLVVVHSRGRDRARAALARDEVDPDAPAAFEMPFPVDSSAAARRLAVLVESRLVDVYAGQAAEFEGAERRYVVASAAECAARAVAWGGRTSAFPGDKAAQSAPVPPSTNRQPSTSAVPDTGDGAVVSP